MRKEGFNNPCATGRTDGLGDLPCFSPRLSWASIPVGLEVCCTVFECSLTYLQLDPFSGELGTQNIRKKTSGSDLRSRFSSRCCRRGGRALLRKAALDKIAPIN